MSETPSLDMSELLRRIRSKFQNGSDAIPEYLGDICDAVGLSREEVIRTLDDWQGERLLTWRWGNGEDAQERRLPGDRDDLILIMPPQRRPRDADDIRRGPDAGKSDARRDRATGVLDEMLDRARAVPIGTIARSIPGLKRTGKQFAGPCKCGGTDRLWIDCIKSRWGCRQCGVGGDQIVLVRFRDGVDFVEAVRILVNEPTKGQRPRPHPTGAQEN